MVLDKGLNKCILMNTKIGTCGRLTVLVVKRRPQDYKNAPDWTGLEHAHACVVKRRQ